MALKLYQFPHSHFSEKARWALSFKGLDFEIINLPRGPHEKIFRKMGLAETSVPVLENGDDIIQGSGDILSYLDEKFPDKPLMPNGSKRQGEILEFESYLDDAVGHHGRRYIYSIFLAHPPLIKDLFMREAGPIKRALFPLLYPAIKRKIHNKLNLSDAATQESRIELERAFATLNHRLEETNYLFGNQVTRADITAAALTAIFTWPEQHEFDWPDVATLPAEVTDFRNSLKDQRFFTWCQDMYKTRHG